MDLRCTCTLEPVAENQWTEPAGGYTAPKSDCPLCGGSGIRGQARFPDEEDIEAFWVGICSLCGFENGGYIQLRGQPSPLESLAEQKWPPQCLNPACPSEHVQWVRADDLN